LNSITGPGLQNLKEQNFIFKDMLLYINVKDGEKARRKTIQQNKFK
jgi:hypothetical protein